VSCFEAERQMYGEQIAERDDQIDKLQQEKLELGIEVEKLQAEKDEIIAERDRNLENNLAELNHTVRRRPLSTLIFKKRCRRFNRKEMQFIGNL